MAKKTIENLLCCTATRNILLVYLFKKTFFRQMYLQQFNFKFRMKEYVGIFFLSLHKMELKKMSKETPILSFFSRHKNKFLALIFIEANGQKSYTDRT